MRQRYVFSIIFPILSSFALYLCNRKQFGWCVAMRLEAFHAWLAGEEKMRRL